MKLYYHRKFGPSSKPTLCYNNNLNDLQQNILKKTTSK